MVAATLVNALEISPTIVEESNDQNDNVKKYSLFDYKYGTTWLAFRDVGALFRKYVPGTDGVDYGCGSGRSTRFLRTLGLNPVGVDISDKMLSEARAIDSSTGEKHTYHTINSGSLPFADKTHSYVFSSFVFLVIPTKEEMVKVLREMKRVLKDDGSVIIATGSEKMHDPKRAWVSYKTDYPENQTLERGSLAKVGIKDVGAEFYDYNWFDEDYQEAFKESGFRVREQVAPLGSSDDGSKWQDELTHSPYYIYVLGKV